MFYYQAICTVHNFASNLFVNRHSAVKSALAHRSKVPGPHQMKILKVFIPQSSIEVRSEDII
ncbi:hypothetical protein [Tenacibaculum sp. 190524A05c]|uniref:hypothetical protein n=1 Tax=Tenacibaculum platacis TaxID=3137852 RepID=UPI0032B1103A